MKIKDRGYWISKLYKYQSLGCGFLCALYFRDLTFFSGANPNIYLGGMLDEKKSDIYDLVPGEYVPKTKLYKADSSILEDVLRTFSFPIVIKPNVGYKGFLVKRMDTPEELKAGLVDYYGREILVQQFILEEKEYSVMYYRLGHKNEFGITSLIEKHMPTIEGDGHSTLVELITKDTNPFLNKNWLLKKYQVQLGRVLDQGEKMIIDHVGNYSRGAKFESLNHKIDQRLKDSIHAFFEKLQGFHFCRLDVKADSLENLKNGQFKLLEINGAKSEPLHIYDPTVSFKEAMVDISRHWRILFKVVRENNHGAKNPSTAEGFRSWRSLKKMMN